MFIVAQILGILALIAYIISTQINNRHGILLWRTIYSALYTIQYLCLGSPSGAVSSIVPVIRNLVYDRYKKRDIPIFWIVIFSAITFILGIVFYDGPISFLPIIHTILFTIFIGIGNLARFRFVSIVSTILMLVYNFTIGAYSGVAVVITQFIFTIIAAVRFDRKIYVKFFSKHFKPKKRKKAHS